jgi:RNA polymerase sigma-70 factor (ECF subfamily)
MTGQWRILNPPEPNLSSPNDMASSTSVKRASGWWWPSAETAKQQESMLHLTSDPPNEWEGAKWTKGLRVRAPECAKKIATIIDRARPDATGYSLSTAAMSFALVAATRTAVMDENADWLAAFHRADRATMEACYREHHAAVTRAVGTVLTGADQETVVQEVFLRLLSSEPMRRTFLGGSLGAWLGRVARNLAVDYWRRHRLEAGHDGEGPPDAHVTAARQEAEMDARLLVERFRREKLPPQWIPVFEARFLQQLSQREAARALGVFRTTLAYQELRIRQLMNEFLDELAR